MSKCPRIQLTRQTYLIIGRYFPTAWQTGNTEEAGFLIPEGGGRGIAPPG